MRQRGFLLGSQHQAITPGSGHPPNGRCRETMPSPLCKPVSGPLKPLLDRDHLARGEPLLPFPVLPHPHQLGRRLHRAHSGIELVLAVAVPMDEHRHVAGGERPLLPRDSVTYHPRPRHVSLAICAPDPAMVHSCPTPTSAGDAFTALIAESNWSLPSLCRWTNIARSRVVNVACCRVIASNAIPGSAMIFSPFARAIRAWSSTRSASSPCSGIRDAAGPILCCGSSSIPCAANVRWSIRASISSDASRSLT